MSGYKLVANSLRLAPLGCPRQPVPQPQQYQYQLATPPRQRRRETSYLICAAWVTSASQARWLKPVGSRAGANLNSLEMGGEAVRVNARGGLDASADMPPEEGP